MRARSFSILILVAAMCLGGAARAGTVICNPGISLDASDIRAIYGGEMLSKGEIRIVAVDNLAAQEHFLSAVIGSDTTTYQNHWTSLSLRAGMNPPAVDHSDAEVISFVRRTPGGVGYIGGAAPAGVTVVMSY